MNNYTDITLKSICCTCLSLDRKLTQLIRIKDGLNKLFFLLSYDSDAYEAMFHKDAMNLYICWECNAYMDKLCKFRNKVCIAQKQLTDIMDGKNITLKLKISLSQLTHVHQTSYNKEYVVNDEILDNFIDCGQDIDFFKTESDTDDIPLSKLKQNLDEAEPPDIIATPGRKSRIKKKRNVKTKEVVLGNKYSEIKMSDEDMIESIEKQKLFDCFVNASIKCESCVIGFKDHYELEKHNLELHVEKDHHIQCDICMVYVQEESFTEHRSRHFVKYICNICFNVSYNIQDLSGHMKSDHSINIKLKNYKKKKSKKTATEIKQKKKADISPLGYMCTECDQHFENKNKRYKHIQKFHREGFECTTCGKKFAFKNTLNRHKQTHGVPAREQCAACGKLVRADLRRAHAATHAPRAPHHCRACDKRFVSRASYANHLKYSLRHAVADVLRHKCTMCTKGYRSRGELRDHVNYQHLGTTRHKCPICDKALATRRCITRHVKRAHQGIKENARDKICQTCGKAFRDKKCLWEHELIHSGARPLACEQCGRAFRQRASLYTHRRRVHGAGRAGPGRVVLGPGRAAEGAT